MKIPLSLYCIITISPHCSFKEVSTTPPNTLLASLFTIMAITIAHKTSPAQQGSFICKPFKCLDVNISILYTDWWHISRLVVHLESLISHSRNLNAMDGEWTWCKVSSFFIFKSNFLAYVSVIKDCLIPRTWGMVWFWNDWIGQCPIEIHREIVKRFYPLEIYEAMLLLPFF